MLSADEKYRQEVIGWSTAIYNLLGLVRKESNIQGEFLQKKQI